MWWLFENIWTVFRLFSNIFGIEVYFEDFMHVFQQKDLFMNNK